jgi:hypothetical protein
MKGKGSVERINTKKRGQLGCPREKPGAEESHGELTLECLLFVLPCESQVQE